MTDLISSKGRMATSGPSNRELMEKAEGRKSSASDAAAASSTPAPALRDEFVPSDVAKQAMSSEPFDQAKVDAIKQAIQDGQYPLDSRRIAESFMAVERMIGG
jgi:negative regulator of flagellin synthesis FlgM